MPLPDPLPLPGYCFDYSLSEDDNFLTWATVLARSSYSRKGHMAAMIVQPPLDNSYDPRTSSAPSGSSPALIGAFNPTPTSRVISYANNYPINYARNPKSVGEIHAETHCIALAARHGKSVEGCTIYITFPPCSDCLRVIIASGIRRCVFRKGLTRDNGEQILVAAAANGLEMVGTSAAYKYLVPLNDSRDGGKPTYEDDLPSILAMEREGEEAREAKAKATWERNGDTAQKTRARVDAFWEDWLARHQTIAKKVEEDWSIWERIEKAGRAKDGARWIDKVLEQDKIRKDQNVKEVMMTKSKPRGHDTADPNGHTVEYQRPGKRPIGALLDNADLQSESGPACGGVR